MVNGLKKKLCVLLSAILCVVPLSGCSLSKSEPANVYLPENANIIHPAASSSTSSSVSGGNVNEPEELLSSSSNSVTSSSAETPTVTPDEPTEPVALIDNFRGKWYYNHISRKRKQVYARLYSCVENNAEEFDVSDLDVSKQDVFDAYWAFDYENPQFLTLGSGYEITFLNSKVSNKVKSVKINYGRTADEVGQTEFEARAETVLEEARAQDSDYEKLKYVHDWIVDNTVYTKSGAAYESEADGPIVYGQALCEGYSKAFMYFAQSLGFQCICAIGSGHLEDHMWNMVKLGGTWYNVDVTWDDPVKSDGIQELWHDYFLINDAQFRLDHRVEHPLVLPNAPDGYFPYGYDPDEENVSDVN